MFCSQLCQEYFQRFLNDDSTQNLESCLECLTLINKSLPALRVINTMLIFCYSHCHTYLIGVLLKYRVRASWHNDIPARKLKVVRKVMDLESHLQFNCTVCTACFFRLPKATAFNKHINRVIKSSLLNLLMLTQSVRVVVVYRHSMMCRRLPYNGGTLMLAPSGYTTVA